MKKAHCPPGSLFVAILLIGDSHTYQSFGRKLDGLLRTRPEASVATFASWGSNPESWLLGDAPGHAVFEHLPDGRLIDTEKGATPVFADLLERYHPQLTIIALGANLYSAPMDYSASVVKRLAEMTARAGSQCLWVGPPDSRTRTGPAMNELYGVLRGASTPECAFTDSRALTHYPASGGDGLHYDYLGPEGLRQTDAWATAIYERARAIVSSGFGGV
ncbi:hypothetical protein WDW37_00060 [Bdellovibrionota bacterium FG-1]